MGQSERFSRKEEILERSKSTCPKCLKLIDSMILSRDNKVYMIKDCPDHGKFENVIYSDINDYKNALKYNKPGKKPRLLQGEVNNGCPNDCGLCDNHKQHTCVGIIEITDKCNLKCPVCFAASNGSYTLPYDQVKRMIDLYLKCEDEPEVLQISGGEPTLHPEILKILEYAGNNGIKYPMLNTNGIKLADRDFAEKISQTNRSLNTILSNPVIYLQFDGFNDDIYLKLRGETLLDLKMKAIQNCRDFGMNVVLVPTIVKGVNDQEMGKIIEFALNDNNIKGVNFQPAIRIGRYDLDNPEDGCLTIPDILALIQSQSNDLIKQGSFINIPCPYPTCSVCTYVYKGEMGNLVLTDYFDVDDYIDSISNRTVPDIGISSKINEALNSLLSMSTVMGSKETEDAICTSCGMVIPNIKELIENITLISVHSFMDVQNFDLNRAQKCCVTEILPNGQMIPFCVYNIFYRKNLTSELNKFC